MSSDMLSHGARVPDSVLMREVEGESVLLDLKQGYYFGLNATGTRMWQVIIEADSLDAACERLAAEYDVDRETLRRDLATLVNDLVAHGLLEWHG
jgi:hypothetical protein